jgi:mono/diheme cytochrome c family protein
MLRPLTPGAALIVLGAFVSVSCGPAGQKSQMQPKAQSRQSDSDGLDPWRQGAPIPLEGRANPLGLAPDQVGQSIRQGRLAALEYPVSITGLQLPLETLEKTLSPGPKHPALALVRQAFRSRMGFDTVDGLGEWLGLHPFPQEEGTGGFFVPFPAGVRPEHRMGHSAFATPVAPDRLALTFGCAACHSSNFFGHAILGMTNRFPRANELFAIGTAALASVPRGVVHPLFGIVQGDVPIFLSSRERVGAIEGVQPLALGLDTSLALVGLSLSRRAPGGDAAFHPGFEKTPRENVLRSQPADSKPAVWWNLKYKNRWLSDGSVISGNPIFTNFLWNEIGRGSDLSQLRAWMASNATVMDDLTTAVFASEAPRWEQIFGHGGIDLNAAQRGEVVYNNYCARCHGSFEKGWESGAFQGVDLSQLSPAEASLASRTVVFRYFEQTPVIDVGTDPARHLGMDGLLELNDLALSREFGTLIEPQRGYVPPPLVGIFSRYPYLHNNAVPNLCQLLLPSEERVGEYWARPAEDPDLDFDSDCVGYPVAAGADTMTPIGRTQEFLFRSNRPGLLNKGHDEGIFVRSGKVLWTAEERLDLIEFLKTL